MNESVEAEQNGDKETAESKLRQAEMIENLEKYTAKVFQNPDGITTQKRWQVRITDNESVPAFFNGIEIREIIKYDVSQSTQLLSTKRKLK